MPEKSTLKKLPESDKSAIKDLLQKAEQIPFPKNISPMLATLVDKPFDESGWLYEVKWDGYRALAYVNNNNVNICSRNNKSFFCWVLTICSVLILVSFFTSSGFLSTLNPSKEG